MNYDLIVVGSSFASSFFLYKYLQKSEARVKVLVLERGEFLSHQNRLERARNKPLGRISFISSSTKGSLYQTQSDKPWIFDPSFGGSSNCWTGCTPRFMPADFKLKSKYGLGMDWPLQYNDLEPYYCEAEEIMAISGPEQTPYPMSKGYPLPPHALNTVDKILNREFGPLYISQPTARASIAGKRSPCCASSICHLCPVGAKFTIENGLMAIYKDPRVTIQYNTQVTALDVEGGLVKGVVGHRNGNYEKHLAQVVALGGNAIFNAHILLNSRDSNPNTGRYLSEQVGYYGYVHLHNLDNLGGSTIITANGFMLYDEPSRKEAAACLIENHNDPFIRAAHGKWRKIAKFKFVFEDIPQAQNRVTRSDNELIPKIEYSGHSKYVERGYDHVRVKLPDLLSKLPVEEILFDDNHQASESHILGSTRMSKNPDDGVVDTNLIHHTYRNVFVLGGGSFPTISPANPTLTLSALSLRAADKTFGS